MNGEFLHVFYSLLSARKPPSTVQGRGDGASRTQYTSENSVRRVESKVRTQADKEKGFVPTLEPREGNVHFIDDGGYLSIRKILGFEIKISRQG